jgi:hypothetical protein
MLHRLDVIWMKNFLKVVVRYATIISTSHNIVLFTTNVLCDLSKVNIGKYTHKGIDKWFKVFVKPIDKHANSLYWFTFFLTITINAFKQKTWLCIKATCSIGIRKDSLLLVHDKYTSRWHIFMQTFFYFNNLCHLDTKITKTTYVLHVFATNKTPP